MDEDKLIKNQNNQQHSNNMQSLVRLCTAEIQRRLKYAKESTWSREPINKFEEFLAYVTNSQKWSIWDINYTYIYIIYIIYIIHLYVMYLYLYVSI